MNIIWLSNEEDATTRLALRKMGHKVTPLHYNPDRGLDHAVSSLVRLGQDMENPLVVGVGEGGAIAHLSPFPAVLVCPILKPKSCTLYGTEAARVEAETLLLKPSKHPRAVLYGTEDDVGTKPENWPEAFLHGVHSGHELCKSIDPNFIVDMGERFE